MNNKKKIRVAIIGSGVSGLVAIKSCREEGDLFQEIVCYERSSSLGGLWNYRHDQERDSDQRDGEKDTISVMYNTIANSSKEMSAFSDFPPPPSMPNFMHHRKMYSYIESYARHFDCVQHIQFGSHVTEVSRQDSQWKVIVTDTIADNNNVPQTREEYFDAVLVCTGHHGKPVIPTFTGIQGFRGEIVHTQNYTKGTKFEDKKVVVVGAGNSGLDVAVELSSLAQKVYLSTRSGCWVLPRLGFRGGRPYDTSFLSRSMHTLKDSFPASCISFVIETMLNRRFDHQLFGLRPSHPLFHEHPTINDQLASKILCGMVCVKADIDKVLPDSVLFAGDESPCDVDTIILATGYHVDYPLLSTELKHEIFGPDQKAVNLYKYVFPIIGQPDGMLVHRLAFIGVPNALGPLFPIAEMQARWVVQVLKGSTSLPSLSQMRDYLTVQRQRRQRKFTETPRHGVQVEWIPYLDEIALEIGCKLDFGHLFLKDHKLWSRLYFGPSLPYQYRLKGPNPWPGARDAIFGAKDRMDYPLAVNRQSLIGKDAVSKNPLYSDHNWLFAFFWGVLGALFMDVIFFYS